MNDRELAIDLIKRVNANLDKELIEFEAAFQAKDFSRLNMIAHKLKGSAANLSAEPLRTICAQIELLAKSDDWKPTPGALENLRETAIEFRAAAQFLIADNQIP